MSAEGQLYNAALFAGLDSSTIASTSSTTLDTPENDQDPTSDPAFLIRNPPHADLALEYLSIVQSLKTNTPISGVKGHLFKLMRPGLSRETDLRERLGRIKVNQKKPGETLEQYVELCREVKARMDVCNFHLKFLSNSNFASRVIPSATRRQQRAYRSRIWSKLSP